MKKTYIIPETISSEKIILSDICGTSPTVTGDGTGDGTNPPGWGGYDDGTHDPDAKYRDDIDYEIMQQMQQQQNSNGLW